LLSQQFTQLRGASLRRVVCICQDHAVLFCSSCSGRISDDPAECRL